MYYPSSRVNYSKLILNCAVLACGGLLWVALQFMPKLDTPPHEPFRPVTDSAGSPTMQTVPNVTAVGSGITDDEILEAIKPKTPAPSISQEDEEYRQGFEAFARATANLSIKDRRIVFGVIQVLRDRADGVEPLSLGANVSSRTLTRVLGLLDRIGAVNKVGFDYFVDEYQRTALRQNSTKRHIAPEVKDKFNNVVWAEESK